MKQIKYFAQHYVDLLSKLGLFRFSALLATVFVVLAVLIQISMTLLFDGEIAKNDMIRSVLFGLLISPAVVYFLSVVVEQLEESRQRLTNLVVKLEDMRQRDMTLHAKLTDNIAQLNLEIEERKRAEEGREEAMNDLENEVYHREKAQLELAERTALLRSFIDASPDLIYYRNEKGQFSGCNKAMEELLGKKEKKLVGLTPWDVYRSDIAEKVVATDKQVFETNQSLTYEQWLEYQDGRKAYFELRKVPFYAKDGRRLGLVGFGREITERKQYQDALEKASRDKTEFISTISHELRTPLNGIVGLSRMLLDTKLEQAQLEYLRTIHVSAITLGNIFNDIIDMDKSDRHRLALAVEPINFFDFISEIENISALMAEQKGLRFSLDKLTDLPKNVLLDATRLRQILWNLVGNAVKFTKQGAVNVSVSCQMEEERVHIYFEVEDSGIGIPETELEHIFAMYYQVKQGQNELNAVGTGIGLAVSRQLAHLMDGDIQVESEVGEGSVFRLSIQVPLVTLSLKEVDEGSDLRLLRILLVEDIELNVIVAKSFLESLGHQVEVARNGTEALACFQKGKFDLLLLDIQLPDMTGFDIARHLRTHYSALPPLVALTANVIQDKTKYIQQGMDDAISKPIDVSAMKRILNHVHFVNPLEIPSEQGQTLPDIQLAETTDVNLANILDLDMLNDYCELVGVDLLLQNIAVFEKQMPEYLAILDSNFVARDQDGIVNEAHKIKGAAGSIGLKRMQMVAQQAQSPELPTWWENIPNWIDILKTGHHKDIVILKDWLNRQKDK